jgi:hypothetical protein
LPREFRKTIQFSLTEEKPSRISDGPWLKLAKEQGYPTGGLRNEDLSSMI